MISKPHNLVRNYPPAGGVSPRRVAADSPHRRVGQVFVWLMAAGIWMIFATSARAQYRPDLNDMGTPRAEPNAPIVLKPNAALPLDLAFNSSDGKPVKLGDYFNHDKPVILSMVYFSCPNLCGITQDNLAAFVRASPEGIQLGKDYDIVVVSIDPDDTAADAALKRKHYLGLVPLPESQAGFTYLTGTEANIRTLAETIGFPYRMNPANSGANKFAHDSAIFICTPDGHLSQTIQGVTYQPDEVHYRLRQASGGKIGGTLLGVCLSCGAIYFNPNTGRYENNPWFYAGTATGLVTIGFMAMFFVMLFKSDARRRNLTAGPKEAPPTSDAASGNSKQETQD